MQIPMHHRCNAVETICYEAQARLSDPVCGCVSIIIGLQQRLQTSNLKYCLNHPNKSPNHSTLNLTICHNSNMNMFDSILYNHTNDHQTDFNPLIFDHLQFTEQFYKNEDDDDETDDPLVFVDQMFLI
ncbi:hypothetical protein R6Q57_016949 [Mikania cordata]